MENIQLSDRLTITKAIAEEFRESLVEKSLADIEAYLAILNIERAARVSRIETFKVEQREKAKGSFDDRVERAIVEVASYCDGAQENDKKGFNRFDAKFGRQLAEELLASDWWRDRSKEHPWSRKTARVARSIAHRYRGQVDFEIPLWGAIAPQYEESEDGTAKHRVFIAAPQSRKSEDVAMRVNNLLLEGDDSAVPDKVLCVKCPYSKQDKWAAPNVNVKLKAVDPYPQYDSDWDSHWVYPLCDRSVEGVIEALQEGFRIEPEVWEFLAETEMRKLERQNAELAARLSAAADAKEAAQIRAEIEAEEARRAEEAAAARRKITDEALAMVAKADFTSPLKNGRSLYSHQREGAEWLLKTRAENLKGRILADKVGVGKTAQALAAAREIYRQLGYAVLVIAPASLLQNWHDEAEAFDLPIETYTWSALPAPLETKKFVVIADECHYAKNPESSRSKGFQVIAAHENCYVTYMLTGTPYPNGRGHEIFPLLKAAQHTLAVGPDGSGVLKMPDGKKPSAKSVFYKRFCAGAGELSHGAELQVLTRDVLLQRTKKDCPELPKELMEAGVRYYPTVHLSKKETKDFVQGIDSFAEEFRQKYGSAVRTAKAKLHEVQALRFDQMGPDGKIEWPAPLPKGFDPEADELPTPLRVTKKEAVKKAKADLNKAERSQAAEALVTLGRMRSLAAQSKADWTIQTAIEYCQDNGALCIFGATLAPLSYIHQHLSASGLTCEMITGETKKRDRSKIVKRFQAGEIQVIVASIRACGTGLTMTAASTAILHERDWTPGGNEQAEGRIHRIGQEESVTYIWPQLDGTIPGSIDIAVDDIIQKKQTRIDLVMQGKRKTMNRLETIGDFAKELLVEKEKAFL